MNIVVDELDERIVSLLSESPRLSVLEASRRLGVARGTVQARIERLNKSAVISHWGPRVAPEALGYTVKAFVSLTIHQGQGHGPLAESLMKIPEVLELNTVSGDSDFLAVVVARSNEDLQRVLDRMMSTRVIQRSSSVIVLQTLMEHRTEGLLGASVERNREEKRSEVGARKDPTEDCAPWTA